MALPLTLVKCGANLFALDSGAETFPVIIFESALENQTETEMRNQPRAPTAHTHPHTGRQNYTYALVDAVGLADWAELPATRHFKLKQIVNDAARGGVCGMLVEMGVWASVCVDVC